jgi:hypothetical protein
VFQCRYQHRPLLLLLLLLLLMMMRPLPLRLAVGSTRHTRTQLLLLLTRLTERLDGQHFLLRTALPSHFRLRLHCV